MFPLPIFIPVLQRFKETRFDTFPSLSSLSSRPVSSSGESKWSKSRETFQKLWSFVFQNNDYHTDDGFIPNYRWLPILSGVTIPFAILLQIPGCTERWYVRTEDNLTIDSRPNPSILLTANILAMIAALIANICLIIRFLERRVKQMTIISLAFLAVHDVINTVTVAVFGVEHRFSDGFTYGQPFWLVVASTVVSLFTTLTLIWDLWTTPEFSKSGSGLTRKQRSLVIIVMVLLCWITLGGLVNSVLLKLTFIDGLYFTVVSIETIGFGDIHPNSTGSRIFAVVYDSIGILHFGLAISTARETIIESFETSYRRRVKEVSERRNEYKKLKAAERARKLIIERMLRDAGLPIYISDPLRPNKMTLNEEALSSIQQAAAQDEALAGRLGDEFYLSNGEKQSPNLFLTGRNFSRESYEENYKNFRANILREERREFAVKLTVAWTIFLTFWLIGAGIFSLTEKWSYGISLYFCFVAFSSIGYGDFSPETPAGRSIFVVWALMGVGAMTILISVLGEAFSSRYKNALSKGSLERAVKNFRERRATSPPPHASRSQIRSHSADASNNSLYTHEKARRDLEALPAELWSHAKTFHEHVYYFLNGLDGNDPPPKIFRKLLDEMAESEHMDPGLKREVLGDDGARKTLFLMSYEGALQRMIHTAEKAVALLARRDLVHREDGIREDYGILTTHAQDLEANVSKSSPYQADSKLGLPLDTQRYRKLTVPRGAVSEPDLVLEPMAALYP